MAAGDGLISMTPTSIAYSGTSAGINADGGVDFTAVTELSLNGVFTGDYDNYLVIFGDVATSHNNLGMRLRASGSDATGSNYSYQTLYANSSFTPGGERYTSQTIWERMFASSSIADVQPLHIYGPALAQPTAARSISGIGYAGAYIRDCAGMHSLSTSYDGFTLITYSFTMSGTVHVFGYEE